MADDSESNKVWSPIHVAVSNTAAILDTLATVLGVYHAGWNSADAFSRIPLATKRKLN